VSDNSLLGILTEDEREKARLRNQVEYLRSERDRWVEEYSRVEAERERLAAENQALETALKVLLRLSPKVEQAEP
jgi:uncharacterized protein (DUF3084 family)